MNSNILKNRFNNFSLTNKTKQNRTTKLLHFWSLVTPPKKEKNGEKERVFKRDFLKDFGVTVDTLYLSKWSQ